MRRETTSPDPTAACAPALATLGLVALLVAFLRERVLRGLRGAGAAQAELLRVQIAMACLAHAAWRQLEAPWDEDAALVEMAACARTMNAALRDLHAALIRERRHHRFALGAPRRPRPEAGGVAVALLPDGAVVVGWRVRDGPR